ncbi:cutinase [Colletotrichum sojae]|uniref:Cutinase n=1 Tax=Colletotrichum sojae TaxID=2175907 RepID=A0A8H6J340_9PEZI|nr:cutinase [Colletotrichum sojae]
MSPSNNHFTIRRLAGLLSIISICSAHFVHGIPASTTNPTTVPDLKTHTADLLNLEARQDIPDFLAQFPSGPLNQFLRIISTLPAGAAALDAVRLILTPLQQGLADSVGINTTENDLARNAACAEVTVIFARGTTEPGNVGLVTGPPFFDALREQLRGKSLAVQGVEYPATFAGFNRNGTDGVPSLTNFVNQAMTRCPTSKLVVSGYSQGALVVRSTTHSLPAATIAKISSVVLFGDPGNPAPVPGAEGKTMVFCHEDDAVCNGGFITVDHLTYAEDASAAAQFVLQRANA